VVHGQHILGADHIPRREVDPPQAGPDLHRRGVDLDQIAGAVMFRNDDVLELEGVVLTGGCGYALPNATSSVFRRSDIHAKRANAADR